MALVCWSGGCDSTLVLYDLAKKSSLAEPVRAISFIHCQIGAGAESMLARDKILAWMRGKGFHIKHQTVEINHKGDFDCVRHGLEQPIMWLANCIPYLEEAEDLYVGWLRGDYAAARSTEAKWAFDYMQGIGGRKGKLITPLMDEDKAEVIGKLEKELLDLCWWCENPVDGKQCGKCDPCVTHRVALAKIELKRNLWSEKEQRLPVWVGPAIADGLKPKEELVEEKKVGEGTVLTGS